MRLGRETTSKDHATVFSSTCVCGGGQRLRGYFTFMRAERLRTGRRGRRPAAAEFPIQL
jgi:hypothetical protein